MSTSYIGSFWNKWDLHLHSPFTHDSNKYNCGVDVWAKTIKEHEIMVVGLTNYFVIEEREYNEVLNALGEDVFVIPNIEFRTSDRNGDGDYINIHVLFNPKEVTIKQINDILSRIELNNIASETSVYCSLESITTIGFDKVTVSVDKLIEQLKKDLPVKDFVVVGVPNGYGGFHPDRKPRNIELAKKMDELSKMMFGRKEDTDFFLSTDNERAKLGFQPKPVLVCSDAHSIGDIGTKKTWIKGEPSFEGLKQVLYEPKYRVNCDENIRKPYRTIESVKFTFPANTKLRNNQTNTDQPFCLAQLKDEIYFSPYFTCIIGGRGAGKSTIVNIMAERLGDKTSFFQNNKIVVEDNSNILKNYENSFVTIKGTNEIEFISQGRVEELSEGSRLTDLIFSERIKAIGAEYDEQEKILMARFQTIDTSITTINELEGLKVTLTSRRLSLENDEKIVSSIENKEYQELSERIAEVSKAIEIIDQDKNGYSEFLTHLAQLLGDYEVADPKNEYAKRLNEIIAEIEKVDEVAKGDSGYTVSAKTFADTEDSLEKLQKELFELKTRVVEYFTQIGSTEDIIADVGRATSNISILKKEIEEIEQDIASMQDKLSKLAEQLTNLHSYANRCNDIIKNRLDKINNDLNIQNENVEKISFEHRFGTERFEKALFSEFYENFKPYHKPSLSWDNIYWCLNLIKPNEEFLKIPYADYMRQIKQHPSLDKNSLYGRVFFEIFDKPSNFEIYKLLIRKNLYDVSTNIEIVGYYGKSPLTSCSFGQRCTAVIVTLLMTGMKPLLIDEPEAHLDNRFVDTGPWYPLVPFYDNPSFRAW